MLAVGHQLQVERAQLKYLMPRLVGAGLALSRLGGGIGTRGPGETKLETDRELRKKITIPAQAVGILRVGWRGAKADPELVRSETARGRLVIF